MVRKVMSSLALALAVAAVGGCSSKAGNVALGAGAAGGVYEYSNKRAMDELKREREEGKISQEEYERRKAEIENRSLVY